MIPFAVLCVLATLFVVWEVGLRRLVPERSIGWHHALLTAWAGVVTGVASGGVYFLMRRQQQHLTSTADQLGRLLESYQADSESPARFKNPHLVHCRDIVNCDQTQCPVYETPGRRCWQEVGLRQAGGNGRAAGTAIQQCHECEVYRRSCPDKLTELGEAFNNLMFLLEVEGERMNRMRDQMAEKEKMVATGQLAAGIAHEVCNPLSSISSIVQLAKRTRPGTEVSEQLNLIEKHIQRISTTVRQLVTLAKPGAEQWQSIDIWETVSSAIELIRFDQRARDVRIVCRPPSSLPETYALPDQLQQVFINLGLNALDAMPCGGKLVVDVGEDLEGGESDLPRLVFRGFGD